MFRGWFFVLGRVNHHLVCIVLLFFSKHQTLLSSSHTEQGPTKDHLTETSLAFLDVPKTSGFGRGKRLVFTFTGFLFFDFLGVLAFFFLGQTGWSSTKLFFLKIPQFPWFSHMKLYE